MNQNTLLMTLLAVAIILSGCGKVVCEPSATSRGTRNNICLVLDGTDRLSSQNGVPEISGEEIMKFVQLLAERGGGYLYVTYVDNDVDNNRVAIFDWLKDEPTPLGPKPGYMKVSEYQALKTEKESELSTYHSKLSEAFEDFSAQCDLVVGDAYTDFVAKQKRGSDVNGAINQAVRLLHGSSGNLGPPYIILISDGCDNVGKELTSDVADAAIILVNSNVSKHSYGDMVVKECVTLRQVSNYIFN